MLRQWENMARRKMKISPSHEHWGRFQSRPGSDAHSSSEQAWGTGWHWEFNFSQNLKGTSAPSQKKFQSTPITLLQSRPFILGVSKLCPHLITTFSAPDTERSPWDGEDVSSQAFSNRTATRLQSAHPWLYVHSAPGTRRREHLPA